MKRMSLCLFACVCASNLYATLFYFSRITANCNENVQAQFTVDVYAVGNDAAFKFENSGPVPSSISEIYFYDGSLLDMSYVDDSCVGVDYEDLGEKVNPKELPGYNPDKAVLEVFSASEAEGPEPENGVKPNEWLLIGYTLQYGKTLQDLLNDMNSGEVVIGLHVKAIDCDPSDASATTFSDSFITVPEPATLALLGVGGLTLLRKGRK